MLQAGAQGLFNKHWLLLSIFSAPPATCHSHPPPEGQRAGGPGGRGKAKVTSSVGLAFCVSLRADRQRKEGATHSLAPTLDPDLCQALYRRAFSDHGDIPWGGPCRHPHSADGKLRSREATAAGRQSQDRNLGDPGPGVCVLPALSKLAGQTQQLVVAKVKGNKEWKQCRCPAVED